MRGQLRHRLASSAPGRTGSALIRTGRAPRWSVPAQRRPSASFAWTSYGFTVVSTIYALAERARVLWGCAGGGITGIDERFFSATRSGVQVPSAGSVGGEA